MNVINCLISANGASITLDKKVCSINIYLLLSLKNKRYWL